MAGIRSAGYTTLTPIQNKAIPLSIEGRDLLGLAQTGTGKTAAFAIPLLQKLSVGYTGKIRALVIAPTRELADQIHQHISQLSSGLKTRSIALYGGVSKNPQDVNMTIFRENTEGIYAGIEFEEGSEDTEL